MTTTCGNENEYYDEYTEACKSLHTHIRQKLGLTGPITGTNVRVTVGFVGGEKGIFVRLTDPELRKKAESCINARPFWTHHNTEYPVVLKAA